MKLTKEQKGITLIALVITIIVLLILAGVALATLTGNSSIIDNANYAVTEYNASANADQNVLNQVEELFARYMGNGNNEQTAAIQEQYGDLVDPSKDTINQELFTYETYEPGESIGLIRHVSGNSGLEGIVSRGDTPSVEQQKGTAKITGINWNYFAGENIEIENTHALESVGLYERELRVSTLAKKQEIERILKKLIVPYEITKDGKTYTVTEIKLNETASFKAENWENSEGYVPFLATTGSYAKSGATSNDATYLIIPACVESVEGVLFLPRDYVIFAEGSKTKSVICSYNEFLQGISLPENLDGEDPLYFSGCQSLKSIRIPNSITKLGYQFFGYCNKLENVDMGEGIKEIDENAFARCESLTNLVISENVETIGRAAFVGCNGLKTMTIPGGISSLGAELFEDCEDLEMESITYNNVVYTKIADLIAALKANNVTLVETSESYYKPTFQGVLLSGDR